ncbi:anti-sigma factor [Streptomyces sp. NA04227]|uniref:anti-sigma factor n=1 Tax=Streptomyces sp. NA04227 TaxID=2742136 RepID=UPI0015909AFE|nr:anti-sigma factor [Streptomyces sp. NA04227]QKW10465.1 anti-sigma factor [Streptomyces sp. NA04227]
MSTADLHTLTGAYALHALDDDEYAAFERHLADCEACAQEVRELRATAGRLGMAVSLVPPPAMRERVLDAATKVRQAPPVTVGVQPSALRVARGQRLLRYALAASLAAAASLGGVAVWQYDRAEEAQNESARARDDAQSVAAVLGAPDATARSARLAGGAGVTVVVSRERDRAVFAADGLPRPEGGRVYQLWFDDGGRMRPAGLLDANGNARPVLMDGRIGSATGMGITVEPAGGSPQPTSRPVAVMQLPA